MFFEEKLEQFIKAKKLTDKDFDIPFTFWSEIFKEIEKRFLIKTDSLYTYQNWETRLKNPSIINKSEYLLRIENDKNYWLILSSKHITSKNLLYDCKGHLIDAVLQFHRDNYFVCDKKYNWLITHNKKDNSYCLSEFSRMHN